MSANLKVNGNSLLPLQMHLAGASNRPLSELTYVAKDNMDVAGFPTGNGNPEFNAWRGTPDANATVIDILQAAGATLTGKTVLHELAYGLTGVNPHYGTSVNPLVPGGIPGGSSSGTAVAVARGVADFGLGTDTGGSVRVPAGFCGLYGWRPTHGLISSEGVVPLGPSFDTVGVLTRTRDVLSRVLQELVTDGSTVPITKLLVPTEVRRWLRDDVTVTWELHMAEFKERGYQVEAIDTDLFERARLAQATLQAAEANAVHREWLESAAPKLGDDVARLMSRAAQVTSEMVEEAKKEREAIIGRLSGILLAGTAMLLPVAPVTPPLLTELASDAGAEFRINGLRLTNLASLVGLPAIAFPAETTDRLPVGLQLIGTASSDQALLDVLG